MKVILGIMGVLVIVVGGWAAWVLTHGAKPLAPPPARPAAAVAQLAALQNYHRQHAERCPQVQIDPALEKEFPHFREALATLRYLLDQDGTRPSTSKFFEQPPPVQLDPQVEAQRRARLRALLDDPTLQLRYRPPKDLEQAKKDFKAGEPIAAAWTESANLISFGLYAGGGSRATGLPDRDVFSLVTTILHELVHVDQVRTENASPGHGSREQETPGYAWEHSIPEELKGLLHADAMSKVETPLRERVGVVGCPAGQPARPTTGGARWILDSVQVNPPTQWEGWTFDAKSTSAQRYGIPADPNHDYQIDGKWTRPEEFDTRGFTVDLELRAKGPTNHIAAGVIWVGGSGLDTDAPEEKRSLQATGRNGGTATAQSSVTFKPQPSASEIKLVIGFNWSVQFTYHYRRSQ